MDLSGCGAVFDDRPSCEDDELNNVWSPSLALDPFLHGPAEFEYYQYQSSLLPPSHYLENDYLCHDQKFPYHPSHYLENDYLCQWPSLSHDPNGYLEYVKPPSDQGYLLHPLSIHPTPSVPFASMNASVSLPEPYMNDYNVPGKHRDRCISPYALPLTGSIPTSLPSERVYATLKDKRRAEAVASMTKNGCMCRAPIRRNIRTPSGRAELEKSGCVIPKSLLDKYFRGISSSGSEPEPEPEPDGASAKHQHTALRRVFVILALIDRRQSLSLFIRDGFDNSMLPLSFTKSLANSHVPNAPESCFNGRNVSQMEAFDENQWFVLPRHPEKIPGSLIFPRLNGRYILPSTKDCEDGPFAILGGFSQVFKVRIHPSHTTVGTSDHDFPSAFALKRISPSKRSAYDFLKEIEALAKFSGHGTGHPHIIKLLTAFSCKDKHYLVFPWAEGNLRTFWRENPTPHVDLKSVVWLAGQLAGLTDALRAIHQYSLRDGLPLFGRHGDIKPSNILVFKNQQDGVSLCIADFGLTRFHSSEVRLNRDQPKAVTPTYRPPEFDLRIPMGQKADIWSLGCVFLEMMVWVLEGYHGLKCFIASRMVTNHDTAGEREKHDAFFVLNQFESQKGLIPSIKPSVKRCIEQLHQAAKCSPFSHDLLNLIEHEMLCVNEQARSTSHWVLKRLQEMQQKCCKEAEYTAPRPPPLKPPWILRHPNHPQTKSSLEIKHFSQIDTALSVDNPTIRVKMTHIQNHRQPDHPGGTPRPSEKGKRRFGEAGFDLCEETLQKRAHVEGEQHGEGITALIPSPDNHLLIRQVADQRAGNLVHPEVQNTQLAFACPFYKRRPDKFTPGSKEYISCATKGWVAISRLKEHLYRVHCRSPYRCNRCYMAYDKKEKLEEHQRAITPCPKAEQPENESIDQSQMLKLKKRNLGKTDELQKPEPKEKNVVKMNEDKWIQIYRIIFESDPTNDIPNPYWEGMHNDGSGTCDSLSGFQKYLHSLCSRGGKIKEKAQVALELLWDFENPDPLSQNTEDPTLPTLECGSYVTTEVLKDQSDITDILEESSTGQGKPDFQLENVCVDDFDFNFLCEEGPSCLRSVYIHE